VAVGSAIGLGAVLAVSVLAGAGGSGHRAGSAPGGDGVHGDAMAIGSPAAAPPTVAPPARNPTSTGPEPGPSTSSSATGPAATTVAVATAPPQDPAVPAVLARPVPVDPPPPPPDAPPPPWAASRFVTAGGHVSTDVGCAVDATAAGLDAFFAERIGPVLGWDYQHVYALGGGRHLWLFQDTFIDHSATAATLDQASFVHNAALVQDGTCFRLLHAGTPERPAPFEAGTGTATLSRWFWPLGGEVHDGVLRVFWAEMTKDAIDPAAPDGLGWHPVRTHVATYDPATMARLDFRPATNPGVAPIYGYAVASDSTHTYLFGNTFEQNLARHGGYWNGPHNGTDMFLARVPRGRVLDPPEYWSSGGWTADPAASEPFLSRHWAEFPMQPRWIDGQWVAATAVDGYWGDEFTLDVAAEPWGPWTTVASHLLFARGFDPLMNTYHAHLVPWRDGAGNLVVTVSNNARNMLRDAWPVPARYRPAIFSTPWHQAPPPPAATTTTMPTTTMPTTTVPTTTTTTTTTSAVATSAPTTTTNSTPTASSTPGPTTSAPTSPGATTTTVPTATTTPTSVPTDDDGSVDASTPSGD
jgi:hypothetical protein